MFSTRAKEYVEALYASRSHVELTVGVLKDGLTQVKHFGPDGKEQEKTYLSGGLYRQNNHRRSFS